MARTARAGCEQWGAPPTEKSPAPAAASPAATARHNPANFITSLIRPRAGSARTLLHERAGLRNLRPDRIGIHRERDRRDVMRPRLAGITRFLRRGGCAELGAQPVRLLL